MPDLPDIVDYPGIGFRVGRTEPFKEAEHPFLECPRDHELRLANASLRLDDKQGLTIQNLSLVPDGNTVKLHAPGGLSIQAGSSAVPALTVGANGNVGIGTAADPKQRLHVEGSILTSGKDVAGILLGDQDPDHAGKPTDQQWRWYAHQNIVRLARESGVGDVLRIGPGADLVNTDSRHVFAVGGPVRVGGDLQVDGKLTVAGGLSILSGAAVQGTLTADSIHTDELKLGRRGGENGGLQPTQDRGLILAATGALFVNANRAEVRMSRFEVIGALLASQTIEFSNDKYEYGHGPDHPSAVLFTRKGSALEIWGAKPTGQRRTVRLRDWLTVHGSLHVLGENELIDGKYGLAVAGRIRAANGWEFLSDVQLKKNIRPLAGVLAKLEQIQAVRFEWKRDHLETLGRCADRIEIGVLAQEVEAVFPELVTEGSESGLKSLDYGRLSAILLQAVRELRGENQRLEQRLKLVEAIAVPGARD